MDASFLRLQKKIVEQKHTRSENITKQKMSNLYELLIPSRADISATFPIFVFRLLPHKKALLEEPYADPKNLVWVDEVTFLMHGVKDEARALALLSLPEDYQSNYCSAFG